MRNLLFITLLFTLFILSCRHEIPVNNNTGGGGGSGSGGGGGGGSTNCNPDTVYFVNSILPLISSSCAKSGCHDPITHAEDLVLNNYNGIMRIVRPGNPSESELYKVIVTTNSGDVMPPPPNPRLPASSISAIQKWIQQGAKNNQCTEACDTATFTYSGAVFPIITNYCRGCHNPASLGGGINLSTYTDIRTVAVNGKLLGSIKHLAGYQPMPQGGNKLSDCQIRQFEKWIQAGMLNN
jgi:hypothetical protein